MIPTVRGHLPDHPVEAVEPGVGEHRDVALR